MNDIRPLLHEILNALAIARGMTENVQYAVSGHVEIPRDDQLEKMERALRAMDRIESATMEIRKEALF